MCNRKRQARTAENNTKGGIPSNMKSMGLGEVEVIYKTGRRRITSHIPANADQRSHQGERIRKREKVVNWCNGCFNPPNVQSCTRGT